MPILTNSPRTIEKVTFGPIKKESVADEIFNRLIKEYEEYFIESKPALRKLHYESP